MTRRTVRRPRPPSPDPDALAWLSGLLGVKHDPALIASIIAGDVEDADVLWMPTTPDAPPRPDYILNDVLQPDVPFLLHGGKKTMKTSVYAHATVAVAAGCDLFGHFAAIRSLCGPVLAWHAEGGSNYIVNCIDKACAVYGVRRRDVPIEIRTIPRKLDNPTFLYLLAARVEALRPRLVIVEPLYLTAPGQWNGTRLTDFNVANFTAVCIRSAAVPSIGHHDKRGETSSGLEQSTGVGPAEWMGQWWHIERVGGDWTGVGDHQLKLTYGSHAGGAGQIGMRMDDETLKVSVVDVEELEAERPSQHKRTAYEMARFVLACTMDADELIAVGELSHKLGGQIEAMCHETVTSRHLQDRVIPVLEQHGVLKVVLKSENKHLVTGGPRFPEETP